MKVYIVTVTWDCHGEVWCAVNEKIPFAMECASFDELIERVKAAVPELLKLNNMEPAGIIHFMAERREGIEDDQL